MKKNNIFDQAPDNYQEQKNTFKKKETEKLIVVLPKNLRRDLKIWATREGFTMAHTIELAFSALKRDWVGENTNTSENKDTNIIKNLLQQGVKADVVATATGMLLADIKNINKKRLEEEKNE